MVYNDIAIHELEKIRELWNKNSQFHIKQSKYFSGEHNEEMFNNRISSWKTYLHLKITVCEVDNKIVAYILSTMKESVAVVESLYVLEENRGLGIGRNILVRHLKWFREIKAQKVSVTTVYGNSSAIEFYKAMGIYPKTVNLELMKG